MTSLADIAALTTRERAAIALFHGGDVSELADKIAAIRDTVRALDGAHIAHALIGGVAVGLRANVARATEDVDFAVPSTTERATLVAAMTGAGFRLVGEHAHSVNFRHASGEPVQLAIDAGFDDAIVRADARDEAGASFRLVQTDDLIAMKRRAAADPARRRSKALRDLADVALLEGDRGDVDEGW